MQEKESQGKKRLNYTVAALAAALAIAMLLPKGKSRPPWRRGGKRLGATLRGGIDYEYVDETHSIHIDRMKKTASYISWRMCSSRALPSSKPPLAAGIRRRQGAHLQHGNQAGRGVRRQRGQLWRARIRRDSAQRRAVPHGTTTRHLLIVDANGDLRVRSEREGENPQELGAQLVDEGALQTFEFGPELVRDGALVEFPVDFTVISTRDTRREPRTAIGQLGPLHYIIVVADGRQDGYSKGMTLQELQQVFMFYGAQTAFNWMAAVPRKCGSAAKSSTSRPAGMSARFPI